MLFYDNNNCFFSTRGYYPKGGGEIHVTVNPLKQLRPVQLLERGSLARITGRAFVAGVLPFRVCFYNKTFILCTILGLSPWVILAIIGHTADLELHVRGGGGNGGKGSKNGGGGEGSFPPTPF